MLQNIFIFIAILATTTFQSSFLPYFFSLEHIPDLMLIITIFAATRVDFSKILIWIVLAGVAMDMAYFAPLGLNVFAFVAIAYVSNFLARRILVTHGNWKFLAIFGLVIVGTFLNDWILAIFGEIISKNNLNYSFSLFFGKDIFIKTIFNLMAVFLIYWPLKKISDYFDFYYSRTRVFK